MKIFLGALTAAMLMGVGCAHNREASKQTEPPRSAQASVEGIQAVPGYSCQVVDSGASGTASGTAQSQSPTLGSESQGGAVSGGALEGGALEGNATGGGLAADEGAVSGGELGGDAIGGSALGEDVASGSAQSGDTLGGSVSEESPAPVVEQKDTATSDAAPKKDAFEETGMGGGGGGGG